MNGMPTGLRDGLMAALIVIPFTMWAQALAATPSAGAILCALIVVSSVVGYVVGLISTGSHLR